MRSKQEELCEIWHLQVCGSALEMAHGCTQRIVEGYIPRLRVCFNQIDSKLNVFRLKKGRKKRYCQDTKAQLMKKILLPKSLVLAMENYCSSEEVISKWLTNDRVLTPEVVQQPRMDIHLPKTTVTFDTYTTQSLKNHENRLPIRWSGTRKTRS